MAGKSKKRSARMATPPAGINRKPGFSKGGKIQAKKYACGGKMKK